MEIRHQREWVVPRRSVVSLEDLPRLVLPVADQLLQPTVVSNVSQKLKEQKNKLAVYYNKGSKRLESLKKGDVVRVLPLPG